MIFYLLYRIGHALAQALPLKSGYWIACRIADIHFALSPRERKAVRENLKIVLNGKRYSDRELNGMAREVFRNFAKYLVDFFRFSKIDGDYMSRHIAVEGLEHLHKAMLKGKGAIALSAHLGNWELGAFVLSRVGGHKLHAVTLTHQNRKVNEFFTRQRVIANVVPIEFGISLRKCYTALKENGLLALLGDRDFSKNGVLIDFFGKKTLIPKGPSIFGTRIGSSIIPVFMVRQRDDTFKFIIEEPIYPDPGTGDDETAVRRLMSRYLPVIERYIRMYPTQWYAFWELWNNDEENMCIDTVL